MNTPTLIAGHVWRPPNVYRTAVVPSRDWPCEYMNCRRPRSEHARRGRQRDAQ